MRIIAGSARGRKLVEFDGLPIRPTLDRVKESFFNQTGPWLEDIRFLDLFAGTGNMGIEALSRGAKRTVFVENNPKRAASFYLTSSVADFLRKTTLPFQMIYGAWFPCLHFRLCPYWKNQENASI